MCAEYLARLKLNYHKPTAAGGSLQQVHSKHKKKISREELATGATAIMTIKINCAASASIQP